MGALLRARQLDREVSSVVPRLNLYAVVAKLSFQRFSTYRAATAAGVFTNTVFGVIISYTYIALWQQRPTLGGYDQTDALTYAWVAQSLLMTVALFSGGFQVELAERVRRGDIAIDLYRPVSLQFWWLASDLGRAAFQLLARGIPPTFFGALLFQLRFPASPLTWVCFLGSVFLGVLVSFGYRYLVALSAFWLVDSRGVDYLVGVTALFFSGMMLPIVVFPSWLATIAHVLPFAATIQTPIDVFLNARTGADLALAMGVQAGWAALLLTVGQILTGLATRKVVVAGG
jgi:ABC-2 type transport system permease protein